MVTYKYIYGPVLASTHYGSKKMGVFAGMGQHVQGQGHWSFRPRPRLMPMAMKIHSQGKSSFSSMARQRFGVIIIIDTINGVIEVSQKKISRFYFINSLH